MAVGPQPFAQDILTRFINVNWPGGEYILLVVEGRQSPDHVNIFLRCPELGWNEIALSAPGVADKVSTPPGNTTTDPVPKFDAGNGFVHAFPHKAEIRSSPSTGTVHILDIGEYGIIERSSGVVINSAVNGFGSPTLPLHVNWTGTGGPVGADGVIWIPSGSSLWSANLALAKAIELGEPGYNWDLNFISEIAGHDEPAGYPVPMAINNRLIFINWSKLKGRLRTLNKTEVDITVRWEPSGVGAKQNYYAWAFMGIYSKAQNYKTWPVKSSGDVSNEQFGDFLNWPDPPTGTRTRWPPGMPAFFPPNLEPPADEVERFPADNPDGGGIAYFSTGETKKSPLEFTFNIKLKGPLPAPDHDVVTVVGPVFDLP